MFWCCQWGLWLNGNSRYHNCTVLKFLKYCFYSAKTLWKYSYWHISDVSRFPAATEHLILNEHVSTVHNVRSHKIQAQLNIINPEIFPQLETFKTKVLAGHTGRWTHFWRSSTLTPCLVCFLLSRSLRLLSTFQMSEPSVSLSSSSGHRWSGRGWFCSVLLVPVVIWPRRELPGCFFSCHQRRHPHLQQRWLPEGGRRGAQLPGGGGPVQEELLCRGRRDAFR